MEEIDQSAPGSGVWEKSENSKWMVVAETSHKIPRRKRTRPEGSVDPSLGIHNFISNFEVELPREGENSVVINDGTSMVRLDSTGDSFSDDSGPSALSEANQDASEHAADDPHEDRRGRTRRRRQRRRTGGRAGFSNNRKVVVCSSVESSPGRDSPSPQSLNRIMLKHCNQLSLR